MSKVQITHIAASKCSANTVGFLTVPGLSEEVLKEAQSRIKGDSTLRISLDGGAVVVSGSVFPPSRDLVNALSKLLSDAYEAVEMRYQAKENAQQNLLLQYSQAYDLPIMLDD